MMKEKDKVIEDVEMVELVKRKEREKEIVNVNKEEEIKKGMKGEEMKELGMMREEGEVELKEGRNNIENKKIMRREIKYERDLKEVIEWEKRDNLIGEKGVMNEGMFERWIGI